HARKIEALLDEPPLCLPLCGRTLGGGPLGDEEDLPRMAKRHLVNAANGAGIERCERLPEIGRLSDSRPDRFAVARGRYRDSGLAIGWTRHVLGTVDGRQVVPA